MEIRTHQQAHSPLLGIPLEVVDGSSATVRLVAIENMVIDDKGLVHGGFSFGLADYAAMLAINDPHVVLVGANIKFTAPVKRGDVMIAKASVIGEKENKIVVNVEVNVDEKTVLTGDFICYVLEKHVLEL